VQGYLEAKRGAFPRFYFVSNPVLLQVLSQGSDPQAVQQYYEKLFDSVSGVEHDKKDKSFIRELISREGNADERIVLRRPVKAAGNIEDWLTELLKEMRRSMKELCDECAQEVAAISSASAGLAAAENSSPNKGAAGGGASVTAGLDLLRAFVDNNCGQYALLGIQLLWTSDSQTALETCRVKKNAMRDANDRSLAVLSTLSSWCLQDLGSRMNRTKIETLVTIQVHQRDVINDLTTLYKNKKLNSADDFEWLKQARFAWRPDAHDAVSIDGACNVSITDVTFDYQFEVRVCCGAL
jgi:dynein heavy chain